MSGDLIVLAIVGSTAFAETGTPERAEATRLINDAIDRYRPDEIVSGGALGIDSKGIRHIAYHLHSNNYAVENAVFGMGGGLLQRCDRDTQRFAFKCSAQMRGGVWYDVQKSPLDASKASKAGRIKLTHKVGEPHRTVPLDAEGDDILRLVFQDGETVSRQTLSEVRERASSETGHRTL